MDILLNAYWSADKKDYCKKERFWMWFKYVRSLYKKGRVPDFN